MNHEPRDMAEVAEHGIQLCRNGEWPEGIKYLEVAAKTEEFTSKLPELLYSFLGYGLAVYDGRPQEGIEYCRKAIRVGFYHPENFLLLAKAYLHLNNRRGAIMTIQRGLKLNPDHAGLVNLQNQIGIRNRPVIPFLPRRASVNRFLGRLRYRWMR